MPRSSPRWMKTVARSETGHSKGFVVFPIRCAFSGQTACCTPRDTSRHRLPGRRHGRDTETQAPGRKREKRHLESGSLAETRRACYIQRGERMRKRDSEKSAMEQVLSLQQVVDRLVHLESEIGIIREEVAALRRPPKAARRLSTTQAALAYSWANKGEQRRIFDDLFAALVIEGSPIGAKRLQRAMAVAGLTDNALSRGIVEAREE